MNGHRRLSVATRAWTSNGSQSATKRRRGGRRRRFEFPTHALVLDTETSIDVGQRLLFGAFRYLRWESGGLLGPNRWVCVAEGLIYADDLPQSDPSGFEQLSSYVRCHRPAVDPTALGCSEPEWELQLLSRTEFAQKWIYGVGVPHDKRLSPAAVVGFNLPFDLSRLASGAGRANADMKGGWSLQIMSGPDGRRLGALPDLAIKSLNSKTASIKNRKASSARFEGAEPKSAPWGGFYVDCRTLAAALTGKPTTLRHTAATYGVAPKGDIDTYGKINNEAVDYCRQDVQTTAELFVALIADFAAHPIDLQPHQVYSSASIAKAYLAAMRLTPLLAPGGAGADTSDQVLGIAMSAFYGGRAECHIRKHPVPVRLVDFTSMYPTVNALMGIWRLLTARQIQIYDDISTVDEIQRFLASLTAASLMTREPWAQLVGLVQILPDADLVPVRADYTFGDHPEPEHRGHWSIAVTPFTDDHPRWYAIADVAASIIRTGHVPRILRAIRFTATGVADGLRPVKLRGDIEIDPRNDDFFVKVIEERATVKDSNPVLAGALKVLANSGGYGIYAQFTRQDTARTVRLHCGDDTRENMRVRADHPEAPGPYCFPPIAACITAAARLMLMLLEHAVTEAGGTWAFCDTDSMAIVATETGTETIECPGGPIRALTYAQVDQIRDQFNQLNPYAPSLVSDLLKVEDRGTGWCICLAAKRYAIFNNGADGSIEILKATEHGLGQLIDPIDPRADTVKSASGCRWWIEDVWRWIIRTVTGQPAELPVWANLPACSRLAISSPGMLAPFRQWNTDKPYAEQVKPFSFMLVATLDLIRIPDDSPVSASAVIAPFASSAADTNLWFDKTGTPIDITVDASAQVDGRIPVKSYARVFNDYLGHPEAKFVDHTGRPCHRDSTGVLQRSHVQATAWAAIGKEANDIDTVEAGYADAKTVSSTFANDADRRRAAAALQALTSLSNRQLGVLIKRDHRTVGRYRRGELCPPDEIVEELERLAENTKSTAP